MTKNELWGSEYIAEVMRTCMLCAFSRKGSLLTYIHMVNPAESDRLDHGPSSISVLSYVLIVT